MPTHTRQRFFWIVLAAELLLFVVWQSAHLGGFQWTTDEGLYMMRARLLGRGYVLYRDIWTDQLPGMVQLTRLALVIGGGRVEAARAAMVLVSAGGLLSLALVARRLAGEVGALVALALVAIVPNYYWLSRAAISPTLPATSLAMVALAGVGGYVARKRSWQLALSGLAMAAALYVKTTAVLLAVPCLVWLWQASSPRRASWRELIVWGASVGLPLLLALLLQHPAAMWRQFVLTQVVSAGMELKIGAHAVKIGAYLAENWGLVAVAVGGLAVILVERRNQAIIGSWLATVLLALLVRSPMWPGHHLSVLLYPLGLLAAVAIEAVVGAVRARRASWAAAIAALGLCAQLAALPGIAVADADLAEAPTYESALAAVSFLQARYPQGAMVISDYHMIPYRAGSAVPPELATVTKKRLQLGLLNADMLAQVAESSDVQALLLWDEQLSGDADFDAWAREHYALALKWGYHDILCLPQPGERVWEADIDAGSALTLERYGVRQLVAQPGEAWELVLYWRVRQDVGQRLQGFVHVVDGDGSLVAQQDQVAFGAQYDSTQWRPGELLEDRYLIAIPADAQPGQYLFSVGLYDAADRQRLALRQRATGQELGGQLVLLPRPVVHWPAVTTPPASQHSVSLLFGEMATLVGWSAEQRGDDVLIDLVWRGGKPAMAPEYVIYAHLRQNGQLAAQADGPPAGGARPTTGWQPDEYIVDARAISTAGLSAGSYDLYVGMYDPLTGVRVPVRGSDGAAMPGDEALLGQVAVSLP